MSTQHELKDLIAQLEAGYITRAEFVELKRRLLSSDVSNQMAADRCCWYRDVSSLMKFLEND